MAEMLGEKLDRDMAFKGSLVGFVDNTHATATQPTLDLITADIIPNEIINHETTTYAVTRRALLQCGESNASHLKYPVLTRFRCVDGVLQRCLVCPSTMRDELDPKNWFIPQACLPPRICCLMEFGDHQSRNGN